MAPDLRDARRTPIRLEARGNPPPLWTGYAVFAGRRFDELTGEEAEERLEEALA